ncbi:hypothetical protein Sjap_008905 [Stephania japonica]|uniref:Uncharacterized protein n=1 Tax=Stephania japonica TaxID=461633 RepID=A0AAP0PEY0_9MAGN
MKKCSIYTIYEVGNTLQEFAEKFTMDAHIANDTKISSPMPAIGLYMAVATLVCLILMLCDIFSAIRQKKPWIPCQFCVQFVHSDTPFNSHQTSK